MAMHLLGIAAEVAGTAGGRRPPITGAGHEVVREVVMRALFAACLVLGLAAGIAGQAADAAAARKHKKQYSAGQSGPAAYRYRRTRGADPNARPDWYPHVQNELPFGSKLGWEQQERERGGTTRD
jgi:hypothetical protein